MSAARAANCSPLVALARTQEPHLMHILNHYTHQPDISADLMQDLYERLIRGKMSGMPGTEKHLLNVMARNIGVDWFRRRRTAQLTFVGESLIGQERWNRFPDSSRAPDRVAQGEDDLQELMRHVRQLPGGMRQVFVLRKVYGHTQKEIAVRLGIAENTVECHLTLAVRQLARSMGQDLFRHYGRRVK